MKKVAELASRLKLEVEKVNKKQAVNWAIECAQRVVHHFERSYPNDPRPRNALEIAKRWLKGETTFKEVRRSSLDAHAAAREAKDPVAVYAARSCAHAVATAHVITHAAGGCCPVRFESHRADRSHVDRKRIVLAVGTIERNREGGIL